MRDAGGVMKLHSTSQTTLTRVRFADSARNPKSVESLEDPPWIRRMALRWRTGLAVAIHGPLALGVACLSFLAGPMAGRLAAAPASDPAPKVVGGHVAPKGAYPWMTALVTRGQSALDGQFCGGALIHPQWVLSAAHCVEGMKASALDVLVGGHDLRVSTQGTRVAVSQIVIHPRFSTANGLLLHDFALLKLSRPLTGVEVLPLVDAAAQVAPGTAVRGMGWGTISEKGPASAVLLEVDMNLFSRTTAAQVYPGLSEAHLAAGVPGGGRDTCQGDSGGPLVVSDGRGGWRHAGTVSFGDGCGRDGIPGIYGNTLTYRSWILQQIGTSGTGDANPIADDHGNTATAATVLTWNTPVRGVLETASDQDWFRLEVGAPGSLSLSSSGTNDVRGTLFGPSGAQIAEDDNSALGPNFLIGVPVGAGTHHLRVSGTGASKGAYAVLAKWTATPVVTGTPEIGVEGPGSAAIPDGALTAKTSDGTDFGSVAVDGGSRSTSFTVRNSGKAALSVGGVRLSGSGAAQFRVTTQPAATVAAGRSAAFQITFDPSLAGRHQATVTVSNNDADEASYDFVIAGTGTVPPDDVGNTPATATRVAVPSTTQARLGTNADLDVFQFTLTQTTTVTLTTTGALDTYGILLDASGKTVAENDDLGVGTNFRIRRKLTAGTYSIVVKGAAGTEIGAYTLQVTP